MIRFLRELKESRPLQTAIFMSLLWHLIWLFVIYIDMRAPIANEKIDPKIYFVGPILSDDAFNMILAERPEFSTTTYRSAEKAAQQSAPSLEPQPQAMERPDPGDLVSVSLGQSTWMSLRNRLDAEKPYPEAVFRKKFRVEVVQKPFPLESGPLAGRGLLTAPVFPALPDRGDVPWTGPEFELTVSEAGLVQSARMVVSSGDPETDRVLERYLKQWQFVPLEEGAKAEVQKGRVRIPADGGRRPK